MPQARAQNSWHIVHSKCTTFTWILPSTGSCGPSGHTNELSPYFCVDSSRSVDHPLPRGCAEPSLGNIGPLHNDTVDPTLVGVPETKSPLTPLALADTSHARERVTLERSASAACFVRVPHLSRKTHIHVKIFSAPAFSARKHLIFL